MSRPGGWMVAASRLPDPARRELLAIAEELNKLSEKLEQLIAAEEEAEEEHRRGP